MGRPSCLLNALHGQLNLSTGTAIGQVKHFLRIPNGTAGGSKFAQRSTADCGRSEKALAGGSENVTQPMMIDS